MYSVNKNQAVCNGRFEFPQLHSKLSLSLTSIAVGSDVTTGTKPCGGKFQPVSFQVGCSHENSLTQTGAFSFSQEL